MSKLRKCKLTVQEVLKLYQSDVDMKIISELAGITRQAIWGIIKQHMTPDRHKVFILICPNCGEEFRRIRALAKKDDKQGNYCSIQCFHSHRKLNKGKVKLEVSVREYRRRARKILTENGHIFKKGEEVHHIDGDITNNILENLMVFPNHTEHMRFHHGNQETIIKDKT